MTRESATTQVFIGWDVGGWNCDRNRESRDAVVILDSGGTLLGTPWRGNLRTAINQAQNSREWLERLLALCQLTSSAAQIQAVLAIDTPLGFSAAFLRLLDRLEYEATIGQSDTNPYLFRYTERFLFEHGLRPLSPVKDMIGSQATKGRHVLAKFAPKLKACGVWHDGARLTAIEAYPSACKASALMQKLLESFFSFQSESVCTAEGNEFDDPDKRDALICALTAGLFWDQPALLAPPTGTTPRMEGWIWLPKDVFGRANADPRKRGR